MSLYTNSELEVAEQAWHKAWAKYIEARKAEGVAWANFNVARKRAEDLARGFGRS